MTIQELLHHTRRNRTILAAAHDASLQIAQIDPASVNVHFDIERYKRQFDALAAAETALSKAL